LALLFVKVGVGQELRTALGHGPAQCYQGQKARSKDKAKAQDKKARQYTAHDVRRTPVRPQTMVADRPFEPTNDAAAA